MVLRLLRRHGLAVLLVVLHVLLLGLRALQVLHLQTRRVGWAGGKATLVAAVPMALRAALSASAARSRVAGARSC